LSKGTDIQKNDRQKAGQEQKDGKLSDEQSPENGLRSIQNSDEPVLTECHRCRNIRGKSFLSKKECTLMKDRQSRE
jgi:hypothetical protein